jgi:hypothetical protein
MRVSAKTTYLPPDYALKSPKGSYAEQWGYAKPGADFGRWIRNIMHVGVDALGDAMGAPPTFEDMPEFDYPTGRMGPEMGYPDYGASAAGMMAGQPRPGEVGYTPGALNEEEFEYQAFVQGSRYALQGFQQGMLADDPTMFPDYVTPAQLELMGWDVATMQDFMENVVGYEWDPESQSWVKTEWPEVQNLGGGYGGGGGYGAGAGYEDKPIVRAGQYMRGGTGQTARADIRFAQRVGGVSPIHWRI